MTSPGASQTGGLEAHPDAGRGAGVDQVARLQHHELAEVVDDEVGVEDHRRGRPGLPPLPVDVQPHAQGQDVVDLVRRREPRAGRVEGLGRLALRPLAAALELEGALADVVDEHEAGDGVPRPSSIVEVAGARGR